MPKIIAAITKIDMDEWIDQVKSLLNIGDRHINFDPHPTTGQLFINYYNLPETIYQAKEGGGAERQNNRIMLTVLFPGKHGWNEKPIAEGVLRVKQDYIFCNTGENFRLRGKTCDPIKMTSYIATYLNRVAKEAVPNYTHSKPPPIA